MPAGQNNIKQWQAKTGNKASGTVTLAYVENSFDVFFSQAPLAAQGQSVAELRCKNWGYKKATPFEFINKICNQFNVQNNSCEETLVTQEYQCE